jgi:hypothetical protein
MAAAPKTNVLAIVGLVLALCVCSPAGAVCGFIARNQIRDSGGTQTGDGLALAAIIIGAIGTVLGILWFIFVVLVSASSDDTLRALAFG